MSYNIHQFEHKGKRYSFVNDELYQTRGSYAYDGFLIRNSEGLYWSNADGWVDYASATPFTKIERESFNLPIDGEWIDETTAAENEEIAKLDSGDWIVVGCIVEEQCSGIEQHNPHASDQRPVHCACCHAKGPWMEVDSCWGIVIDNSIEAMEKFVKEGGI